MKIFHPNLSFEDELADRPGGNSLPRRQILHDLGPLMGLLGGPGDHVLMDSVDDRTVPDRLREIHIGPWPPPVRAPACTDSTLQEVFPEFVPWGWTEEAQKLARTLGCSEQVIPPMDAVRLVNSRTFNAVLDPVRCDRPAELPFGVSSFGALCRTQLEWQNATRRVLERGYSRVVSKPQFSHAGRNRLLTSEATANAAQEGWLNRNLPQGVCVEPWVQVQRQAGLQFQIDPPTEATGTGGIRFIGATQLLTDSAGHYAGSLFSRDDTLDDFWRPALEHGLGVCGAVAVRGYFGPVGIDGFQFHTAAGTPAVRLCNDINARWTMGRLALALRPDLECGESGLWAQVNGSRISRFRSSGPETSWHDRFPDVRMMVTSPQNAQEVRIGTVLLAGTSTQRLMDCLRQSE